MLIVVLGAGASYDSSPAHPPPATGWDDPEGNHEREQLRPPLADQLFDQRPLFGDTLHQMPASLRAIIPQLRDRVQDATVEQVLERLQEQAADYPTGRSQLAAVRFYLRTAITKCAAGWSSTVAKGITNYMQLVNVIHRCTPREERVCFVTFNYDTLLEDALPAIQMGGIRQSIAQYVTYSPKYKVCKLHGSVNWGRRVDIPDPHLVVPDDPMVMPYLIEHADELVISDDYVQAESLVLKEQPGRRTFLFPAIAIPTETKRDFECPEVHLKCLIECIAGMTKLLIIGWQGRDRPFLKLIAEHAPRAPVTRIVAGTEGLGRTVMGNLAPDLPGLLHQTSVLPVGFTGLFRDPSPLERFLRSEARH